MPPIAMARDCHASQAFGFNAHVVQVVFFSDLGHRPCRLAGGKQNEPPHWRRRQQRGEARRGVRGGYRSAIQACEERAQGVIHAAIIAAPPPENLPIIMLRSSPPQGFQCAVKRTPMTMRVVFYNSEKERRR